MSIGEVLDGLWRFTAVHPEWVEDESGEDGWEPDVAWWALASGGGLALIDPLVDDWDALDALVARHGGCAGVVRTCHWHQRSIAEASARYGAGVWAKPHPDGPAALAFDHAVRDGDDVLGGLRVIDVERDDEISLWLPAQRALVFGDAMLRRADGTLRVCPESWTMPAGGPERLLELLRPLTSLPVEHVLVSHGPFAGGGGGVGELGAAVGL